MLHENFEWHEAKAQKNLKKHGVSFDDAALVLSDEAGDVFHVEEYDRSTALARIATSPRRRAGRPHDCPRHRLAR